MSNYLILNHNQFYLLKCQSNIINTSKNGYIASYNDEYKRIGAFE